MSFEKVYRIHAWISMGLFSLFILRFMWVALVIGTPDDAWIALLLCGVIGALWMGGHALAAFRKSPTACYACILIDTIIGVLMLYGLGQMIRAIPHLALWRGWLPLFYWAAIAVWVLSMAVMNILFARWCLGRNQASPEEGDPG